MPIPPLNRMNSKISISGTPWASAPVISSSNRSAPNLSFELGLSYVNENYIVAEDNSFVAGRWGLRFDHFILPKSLQYFLIHTGLQSIENSEDLILFTSTGFRIPFYKNLNVTAQMNWEYDKSPSPGKEGE